MMFWLRRSGGALHRRLLHDLALEGDRDGVTLRNSASLDRLRPRGLLSQLLESLRDGLLGELDPCATERETAIFARVDQRQRVEGRGKRQRLSLFDVDVADRRSLDRLQASLAERFIHGPRDEIVRNLV